MPVAIDSNARPGSSISAGAGPGVNGTVVNMNAASNGVGGAPPVRPTTTSRRGGRSRSPVAVVLGSRLPTPIGGSVGTAGPGTAATGPSDGGNPSSAAAAAAAAAKAYASGRNGATPTTWPPNDNASAPHHDENGYARSSPYDLKSKGPSSSPYPPPSNWPPDANGYRPGPPRVHYDRRGAGPSGFPHNRDDYDRRYDAGPPPPHRYDDRYGGPPPPPSRMPPGGGPHYPSHHHAPPPPPSPHHPDYPYHPSHRYGSSRSGGPHPHHSTPHRGPPSHHRSAPSGSRPPQAVYHPHHLNGGPLPMRGRERPGMGTTLVLGGPTPIHLPKSPVVSSSSSSSKRAGAHRDGTASSVFRGRPHETSSPDPEDENSPQKILLSLRTPTTSFEELKDKKKAKACAGTDSLTPSTHSPQQVLFEPQRSGEGSKVDGTIDIAPSFNLLQSFDSFGDTQYFNIDSSLNADSFGLAQTESLVGNDIANAATQQVLRENSSGGNFSSQFLAPSGSGALTIGYSPVNSFGNASVAASSRRNSMMVVGGMDARSSSPTQVLGIYRSYSGGTVRPLDDSHLRMSVGSFGGNSVLGYNRSYGGEPPTSNSPTSGYYMGPVRSHEGTSDHRMPPFYILLRKFSAAFKDCTFLLPGVKSALLEDSDKNLDEPTDKGLNGHDYPGGSGGYGEPGPQDIVVARRRVESSVCAFGGNLHRGREATKALNNREAIFRGIDGAGDKSSTTVTPSSTDVSNGTQRRRTKYEDELASRYYENESRLSWEFEENPPVEIPLKDEAEIESTESGQTSIKTDQDPLMKDEKGSSEDDLYCMSVNGDDAASTDKGSTGPQAKMRYRCKLCGQPKQNHRCPYQQALARSIGTMVYPAVNAFTADEPGTIAAPLSEMNNFVDIQKDGMEPSPTRPSPDRMRHMTVMSGGPMMSSAQVTPEAMRSSSRPSRSSRHGNKKRMYSQMRSGSADQGDLLFVAAMELKPEQFRVVSQSKMRKTTDAYIYPALPLPYAQRKRLSDNLFSLSNEVPKLTDECAQVLREAREKDLWDLAVAELMTQVIVIIHCTDRDFRFEGLRQYLLTLGIAC